MVIKKEAIFIFLVGVFMVLPFVSAGVGISWDRESALIPENTKTCLTYKVYNPWDSDTNVQIFLSDNLQEIVSSQESENKFIPAQTSSSDAIPVTFCFKTPRVYEADCWIGDKFICKQECTEEMKVFEGEVQVKEFDDSAIDNSGSGGSKTAISVSAPLRVRVQCIEHERNYSLIYLAIVLIATILLVLNILKNKEKVKKGTKKNKKSKSKK